MLKAQTHQNETKSIYEKKGPEMWRQSSFLFHKFVYIFKHTYETTEKSSEKIHKSFQLKRLQSFSA